MFHRRKLVKAACMFLLLNTGLLAACNSSSPSHIKVSEEIVKARFLWFEYSGDDDEFKTALAKDEFRNPILAGYHPDPSIVRVGDDYYLVNSTFGFYPGIPIFHSRDLVNWTQIGNVIHRSEQLDFDGLHLGYNGVYAPAIEHRNGIFYVINTCIGCGGNFVVTASDPAGPWSDPIWMPHLGGIDPSLFFEYLLSWRHSPCSTRIVETTSTSIE
ncbi:Beta-xylosidase [Alteromonadaceae bacterium Bs31]|nr:Beta-xylosidase [Alteromonadaceae bacterium Bs31]